VAIEAPHLPDLSDRGRRRRLEGLHQPRAPGRTLRRGAGSGRRVEREPQGEPRDAEPPQGSK
jgi:hypothetical protein